MIFSEPEVRGAFFSGAGEGVAITANELSFGGTDAIGITDTSTLTESHHDASRVFAATGRDLLIGAGTAGAGELVTQGGGTAVRVANLAGRTYEAVDTAVAVNASAQAAASGNFAGAAVGLAGSGAVPVKAVAGLSRYKPVELTLNGRSLYNGNSRKSMRMQYGYDLLESGSNDVVKTGISGIGPNGHGVLERAQSQVNSLSGSVGPPSHRYEIVYQSVNRSDALVSERFRSLQLRAAGHSMSKHDRP